MKKVLSFAAPALGVAIGLVGSPASAQEACVVVSDVGPTVSGTASGSLACGDGAAANGEATTAIGNGANTTGDFGTAVGTSATATESSVALGVASSAVGTVTTALGTWSNATGLGATAVGHYARGLADYTTALGYSAKVTASQATALGMAAQALHLGSVALGAGSVTTAENQVNVGGRTISNIKGGVVAVGSSEAINGGQLDYYLTKQAYIDASQQAEIDALRASIGSALVTTGTTASGQTAQAVPPAALDPTYADINSTGGAPASATGADAIALGAGAVASHDNSIALGAGSVTTAANQVNVGGRTVSNVAAGSVSATSTDAVNGSQLYATNNRVSALESGLEAMDTRVEALELLAENVNADLSKLDRKIEGSTALAIAMSGNAFLPGKSFNLTGNVGYYRGAVAGSLQFGALVSPNAAFNAGVSTNFNKRSSVGARAGFTFGW